MERSDVATHIAPRANVAKPHLNGHPCGPIAFTDDYKVNGSNTRLALENLRSSSAGSGSLGRPRAYRRRNPSASQEPREAHGWHKAAAFDSGVQGRRTCQACVGMGFIAVPWWRHGDGSCSVPAPKTGRRSVPQHRSCLLLTMRGSQHATRYFEERFGDELGFGDGCWCAC